MTGIERKETESILKLYDSRLLYFKGIRRRISCFQLIFIVFQKEALIVEKWEDFNAKLSRVMLEQIGTE